MSRVAVAVFVKTPGCSPIKTRLASAVGETVALQFYQKCLQQVRKLMAQLNQLNPSLTPYWAVAEKEAMASSYWQDFPQVSQGEGGLGERLHQVYSTLLDSYDVVLLMGADSPQLTVEPFCLALKALEKNELAMGSTEDGGFYLLAGRTPIPQELWTDIAYSQSTTGAHLREALEKELKTSVVPLPTTYDVDHLEDLKRLCRESLEFLTFRCS